MNDFDWINEVPEGYVIEPGKWYAVNDVYSVKPVWDKFCEMVGEDYINWVRSISYINLFDNSVIDEHLLENDCISFSFSFQWDQKYNTHILNKPWL